MPRGITGPFFVNDGGTNYFAILPPQPQLLNAYRMLLEAERLARRNYAGPEGRARALAIDVVLKQVQARVDAASIATAEEAENLIVNRIRATQVRPDPPGSSGRSVRLEDAIQCRPIRTTVAGGGVGIGDITSLDRVADKNGQAYWRAQEFGSTHLVGRTISGYYQPGRSAPGESPPRTHPLFETSEGGAPMTISRPIPERAFLREGAAAAEVFRQRALGKAVSPALGELRLIQAGTHPRLEAARRFTRNRRI